MFLRGSVFEGTSFDDEGDLFVAVESPPQGGAGRRWGQIHFLIPLRFGKLGTGPDPSTLHMYSGEYTDIETGQQYLRARYYDPATGRFNRLDPFAGNMRDPQSLHKYAYGHGDPINNVDPTGKFSLGSSLGSLAIGTSLRGIGIGAVIGGVTGEIGYFASTPANQWTIFGALGATFRGAALGAFGSTLLGAGYFAGKGIYDGVKVWTNPNATGLEKALGSVNVLIGVASAFTLRGQVRSQVDDWVRVYSKIPLQSQIQTNVGAIRGAFNSGKSHMELPRNRRRSTKSV